MVRRRDELVAAKLRRLVCRRFDDENSVASKFRAKVLLLVAGGTRDLHLGLLGRLGQFGLLF